MALRSCGDGTFKFFNSWHGIIDAGVGVFLGAAAVDIGKGLSFEALVLSACVIVCSALVMAAACMKIQLLHKWMRFLESFVGRGAAFLFLGVLALGGNSNGISGWRLLCGGIVIALGILYMLIGCCMKQATPKPLLGSCGVKDAPPAAAAPAAAIEAPAAAAAVESGGGTPDSNPFGGAKGASKGAPKAGAPAKGASSKGAPVAASAKAPQLQTRAPVESNPWANPGAAGAEAEADDLYVPPP